ncbi:MAG: hypothetical protein HOC74_40965, partial [Gemmatimonadetes bacterium]|nr:hypothetical protein [Gemmatimonadota bacterium]
KRVAKEEAHWRQVAFRQIRGGLDLPVILSYGLGVDSTAILVRWLTEPSSRNFSLDKLVVITAMTGDEFADTGRLVTQHILPLLRAHKVRYIQVARGGKHRADGVVRLSDTRAPRKLHLAGAFRLSEELRTAGTVPQRASGRRICSIEYKGFPLDTTIDDIVGTALFRHVIGFNADEGKRAIRDSSYTEIDGNRVAEYPLMEWDWGRQKVQDYVDKWAGEPWPKSCCTYCPFTRSTKEVVKRLDAHPDEALEAMWMEHMSVALNPRVGLYGGKVRLRDRAPAAWKKFEAKLRGHKDWSIYHVRRILSPKEGEPSMKGRAHYRSVRVVYSGTYKEAQRRLTRYRGRSAFLEGSERILVRELPKEPEEYPALEEFYVLAPSGVADKERESFDRRWARANGSSPRYKYLGTNDEQSSCNNCGRTGLKKVAWLVSVDHDGTPDGEPFHVGTTCAALMLKGKRGTPAEARKILSEEERDVQREFITAAAAVVGRRKAPKPKWKTNKWGVQTIQMGSTSWTAGLRPEQHERGNRTRDERLALEQWRIESIGRKAAQDAARRGMVGDAFAFRRSQVEELLPTRQ